MSLQITKLLTEYAENPLGIDQLNPRLSWKMQSEARSTRQSAYRVLVATSMELLVRDEADMWDSGKVESDQSVHVHYAGETLTTGSAYVWKVKVWDESGQESDWSEPGSWSMGMLKKADWQAKWIGMQIPHTEDYPPVGYLRKTFSLAQKSIKRAIVYSSAMGHYELYLGGKKVGDHEFAPGWTDYNVRIQYQTYDVTDQVNAGDNVFAAILGTGWYSGKLAMVGKRSYGYAPYVMAQLHIEYEDGTTEQVTTDETWKTSEGPLQYSEIYRGEVYDARKELDGWLEHSFDDRDWNRPMELAYRGYEYGGELVAQMDPPVRVVEELQPISVTKTEWGTYIFDMGQNMVGNVRLTVEGGQAGQEIVLDHTEMLDEDGSLYRKNLRSATPVDKYIVKGTGVEVYEPKFTFHGFRFVELQGYPGEPDLSTITGRVIHTDAPTAGELKTSHPLVNQLVSNIYWGQRGNFISVPTDCPQRDERLGWTGDAMAFTRTASFNMDVATFFRKYTIDMIDAQLATGSFPDVAPNCGYDARKARKRIGTEWIRPYTAGWADAGIIVPWTLYEVYGDKEILEESYPALVYYMGFLVNMAEGDLIPAYKTQNYGDWLEINAETPKDVISNAFYAHSVDLMSQIAAVLGKEEDAAKYAERAQRIKRAYQAAYVSADGKIEGDTQAAYATALCMNVLDEETAKKAAAHFVEDIERKGYHLTVGFLGVRYLLPALSECGYDEVAYKILMQDTFPSWFYQIEHGATTMWERWDGYTEHGFHNAYRMNSFNHYAAGAVGEWLYRFMAGIESDPDHPGYKHIILQPRPGDGLTELESTFETMYGTIQSAWQVHDGEFEVNFSIPANTTATIRLPEHEGVPTLDEAALANGDLKKVELSNGEVAYQAGSGDYTFRVSLI